MRDLLGRHGFFFRTINGSQSMAQKERALRDFLTDPPTTVFLLSARTAAVGLTLTVATHVYLMEPSLNPATEEQAVGRSLRMGQAKPVRVGALARDGGSCWRSGGSCLRAAARVNWWQLVFLFLTTGASAVVCCCAAGRRVCLHGLPQTSPARM